jgi:hypothetical protein
MGTAAQTAWHISGEEAVSCNCVWACPCQFNARPSNGDCRALITWEIREGHFGDTRLDGLHFAFIVSWPGAIFEGNGTRQLVIDEAADAAQREAIKAMESGVHGGPYFEIFASVLPHEREAVTAPFTFEVDREARRASVRIGSIGELRIEPIRNPVSNLEHRVRIDLPNGFEYKQAEIANSVDCRTSTEPPLDLHLENTYGQLNPFDWSNA